MRSLRAALFCAALRGAAPLRLGQRAARRGSTATSATAASLAPTAPTTVVPPRPSRIVQVAVRGAWPDCGRKTFDVKRDDAWRLLGDFGAGVSGNKARKLFSFAVSGPRGCVVASLGGHQSNAMCALAALCHARGTPFVYLAKPVPKWLRQNPSGNYARALALGMELVPLAPADYARAVRDAGYRNGLLADVALSLRDESDEHQGPPDVEWV
ncbi:hypothetical protein M885DRAFT_571382 [Pelagophyceae sp. CCMP2097]|nr:hypothetical protein M885DRAFT_571382 [Pelagophyceae sp. CCMP2097]